MKKLVNIECRQQRGRKIIRVYNGKTDIGIIRNVLDDLLNALEFMLTKDNFDEMEQLENMKTLCDEYIKKLL